MTEAECRVRLTEAAVQDLHRLHRKDPQILRAVFAKMILLERNTEAGEPLLGALVGFRKLVVGDRHWRIVWRRTTDEAHQPTLEVAEVWAAGARADSEIYEELRQRIASLRRDDDERLASLADVVEEMGRLYADIPVHPEPELRPEIPEWLVQGLKANLHLTDEEIAGLGEDQAKGLLMKHWSGETDDVRHEE